MKQKVALLFLVCMTMFMVARTEDFITVTTGFGYFKDTNGNIIARAELPGGKHPIKRGYTYIQVESKEALDNIELYVKPESEEAKVKRERKKLIESKMQEIAIRELIAEGKIKEAKP